MKTNPLKRGDLDDFVSGYNADNRHERKETERVKSFAYEDLLKRDRVSLDIFWLKDESLEDSANLPDPDVIAGEIARICRRALDQIHADRGRLEEVDDSVVWSNTKSTAEMPGFRAARHAKKLGVDAV